MWKQPYTINALNDPRPRYTDLVKALEKKDHLRARRIIASDCDSAFIIAAAIHHKHFEIIGILIQAEANHLRALEASIRYDSTETFNFMIQCGVDINHSESAPLRYAVLINAANMIRVLFSHGASIPAEQDLAMLLNFDLYPEVSIRTALELLREGVRCSTCYPLTFRKFISAFDTLGIDRQLIINVHDNQAVHDALLCGVFSSAAEVNKMLTNTNRTIGGRF